MIERGMMRTYLHYVVPASIAFTLACVYSIIDGLFVGNHVGDAGLAGINIAWPLYAAVIATGTGIGMGGAVISAIRSGAGDEAGARRATGHTLMMLAVASLPIAFALIAFPQQLCTLLGGRGETLNQAVAYLSTVALAAPLQVLFTGSLPLIRNRGSVKFAMAISIASGFTKIAFDFLFITIMGMGTAGAGAATGVAQIVAFSCVLGFFLRPSERLSLADFKPSAELLLHTAKLGIAPFGLTLMPEVTVIVININAMAYGGESAVAAYAVIAYMAYAVQALIQGVGDGSQPLVSQCQGAGKFSTAAKIRNTNFIVAIAIGLVSFLVLVALRDQIPLWFGASAAAAQMVSFALPLIAFAYLFFGFTHVTMAFFYATDNAQGSSVLVYGEAVLVAVLAVAMGSTLGLTGVWCAIASAQADPFGHRPVYAPSQRREARSCQAVLAACPHPPRPSRASGISTQDRTPKPSLQKRKAPALRRCFPFLFTLLF